MFPILGIALAFVFGILIGECFPRRESAAADIGKWPKASYVERLEHAVRTFRGAGDRMFAAYLRELEVLTPEKLRMVRNMRRALDMARKLAADDERH